MPFITQERRDAIANKVLTDWQPGDLCYIFYKQMIDTWRENPRWTTVDKIYRMMRRSPLPEANKAARELAWQVFFQLHVMPYELKKREENGDI